MRISVLGQTDKRALLYSMLLVTESLGDCCVITNDRKFMRLMEEPAWEGTYRNIDIFITDAVVDEVWQDIEHSPADYEYVFMDNLYSENCDVIIYVMGEGPEPEDELTISAFEDDEYIHVKMGKPEKVKSSPFGSKKDAPKYKSYNIPYTADLAANIEFVEYYKELKPISQAALKAAVEIISELSHIPAKNLMAAAQSRKGGAKQ